MKFGAKEKWEKGKMSEITAMYVCMYVHTIQVQHPYLPVHVCTLHTYIYSLATTAISTRQPETAVEISFGVTRQQGSLITNVTCSLCGAHSRSRLCAA